MITDIRIPQLGTNDLQAILVEWMAKDAAPVEAGQDIALLETSKITHAVTAARKGVLRHKARPGQELPVNALIGWISDKADEPLPAEASEPEVGGPIEITRKARELAEQLGIPLDKLPKGKGMIREQDVRAFAGVKGDAAAAPTPGLPSNVPAAAIDHSKPLSHAQKLTQEKMVESLQQNAHCCITMEAPLDAVLAGIGRLTEKGKDIVRLNDALIFACARALAEYPGFNGFFWNNTHYFYKGVHVGVAMNYNETLLVPVIRNADQKAVAQIAQESGLLQMNVFRQTLSAESLTGGTFTVTNLGTLGVHSFTPIINGHQAAILGIGNPYAAAEWQNNAWRSAQKVLLTLSFDHRLHNGAQAAQFLKSIISHIDQAVIP